MVSIIYHICSGKSWRDQSDHPVYTHPSLESEGFIHAASEDQVAGVLRRYFHGQRNLVKLTIDTRLLTTEVKWEESTGGEKFPHIYGPIELSAVTRVDTLD